MATLSLLLCTSVGSGATPPRAGVHGERHKIICVEATRFKFSPPTITLKTGERVTLRLVSKDVKHGLRIPELGLDIAAPAGGAADVAIVPVKTGVFLGSCSVFCGTGHHSMALTVEVRP